jgi:hypothetical protein
MQMLFDFLLPGPFLPMDHSGSGRNYLAAALDGTDAAWLLQNGHGPAPFKIGERADNILRIVANGAEACTLLTRHASTLEKALSDQAKAPVSLRLGGGECSATASRSYQCYRIKRFLWQTGKASQWETHKALANEGGPAFNAHIAERLMSEIHRSADAFGYPVDDNGILIKVVARPQTPVGIKPESGRFTASAEVLFATNFTFNGIWHVGKLTSRDYGRIFRLRDPKQLEEAS